MRPRPITRRTVLGWLGVAGTGTLLAACDSSGDTPSGGDTSGTTPAGRGTTSTTSTAGERAVVASLTPAMFDEASSCALTPAQTEGPFYVDVDAIRRDIRDDREGAALRLGVRVLRADGCTPVPDAVFEVWHCDAAGVYSGVQGDGARFLRGAQVTDADGIAQITTIYPGWYPGRAVHVHLKVFTSNRETLTSQLYFPDDVTDRVLAAAPYAERGARDTRNEDDGIFRAETVMRVVADGAGHLALANLTIEA
jgi:protocatechuate 3,4-dioxygenase beta subunit